ncbi:YraN family protein [Balneatrix alpica]|uniref:UPF0102 protein ACFFLH_04820 n=1 Tax=Balneatrix alpica TaxID=75684 RepID=A0ABV5Z8X3_9GAMM|nr:YraN family protein [Balneatrix alpica]
MHAFWRGRSGEDRALAFLQQRGWQLLGRNLRLADGELDLVMLDGQTLVFIEVKLRQQQALVDPASAVDARKQQRLRHAAQAFLQANPKWQQHFCRFDVVCVTETNQQFHYQLLSNAFS